MRNTLVVAAVGALTACAWQVLVAHYLYGGNCTGLFLTGERFPPPPPLAAEIRRSPGDGYDGQFYHYIAHDPWFRRGFAPYIDAPRLRYRRMLLPALANLLAAGQDRYIDRTYIALVLLGIFLGIWWTGAFAHLHGSSPWLGLGFLLAPGVMISIDRLVVDGMLATACAGFLWFLETDPGWPLYIVLLAAALVRETGLLLSASYIAALLWERRWRRAAAFLTSALPAAAWFWWVARHTSPEGTPWFHDLPLAGYLHQLLHPNSYPLGSSAALAVVILDYAALAGVALAGFYALRSLRRKTLSPDTIAIVCFAALACLLPSGDFWSDPDGYGRILTPLVLLLALEALRRRQAAMALPMLLVSARLAVQFAGLAVRMVKGLPS